MIKFDPMKHRIPLLKRLIPSVKKRIARLTWWDGWAIRRLNGAVFLLNYRNVVDRQIAFYGDFEADQRRYLFSHIGDSGCDLFLDVGANMGLYSILAARGSLAGRIVAFEPDERARVQMAANLLMNGLLSKVEIVAKAVSKETGSIEFLLSPNTVTGQSKVGAAPARFKSRPCIWMISWTQADFGFLSRWISKGTSSRRSREWSEF